jgi:hypothetical protein
MTIDERLIEKVLASSGVLSRRSRNEIARELRAHLEDAAEEARATGQDESAIEHVISLRFGEPEEIARRFAEVYRAERLAIYFVSFFLLAAASLVAVSAFVGAVQITLAVGMGYPAAWAFPARHIYIEIAMLAGLTLGYQGLYFTERLFRRWRVAKALLLTGAVFVLAGMGLETWLPRSGMALGVAFGCAVFVRALDIFCAKSHWKLAGLFLFFSSHGLLMSFGFMSKQGTSVWVMTGVFCLSIAVWCQFMTLLAAIFDNRVLRRNSA